MHSSKFKRSLKTLIYEEVGISPSSLQVIGNMPLFYSAHQKIYVIPFIAILDQPYDRTLSLSKSELDYVVEPSLHDLANGFFQHVPNKAIDEVEIPKLELGTSVNMEWENWPGPVITIDHPVRDVIWGLSGRILVDFVTKIAQEVK